MNREDTKDYFAFLGMPRKFLIDSSALEKNFYALSWKLHPDNFAQCTPQEQQLNLRQAAVLNDAYRTLRDPVARAEYLLGLLGTRRAGSGAGRSGSSTQVPSELLEEVFEFNTALEEFRVAQPSGYAVPVSEAQAEACATARARLEEERGRFQAMLRKLDEDLQRLFAAWDAAPGSGTLEQIRGCLDRRSYLQNLVRDADKELA